MTHQALYRTWRPQRFEDISGQDVIVKTLKNAIKQDNTSHAYLFTGPRGTGKTSAAKIFAKAINCPYSEDGEPCNECHICQQITKGSLGDVIEIDAASNNGVEEIRDIREKAAYAPTQAVYKVYIIDEVHMLSAGAFNALLKTLEEPPENVIFILATTEPHKIPATIISRTQRFDFKRINTSDIIDRLTYILNDLAVDYEDDAVLIIANAAEGGMRDALSMLDQALSFMTDQLTEEVALQITGSITQGLLLDYIQALSLDQTDQALTILTSILDQGKDAGRFVEDAIMMVRDLLLYQTSDSQDFATKLAKVDDQFTNLAQTLDRQRAYYMIKVLNQTQQDLRLSNHAEVYLEVATVKLTQESSYSQPATQQAQAVDSKELDQVKNELRTLKQSVASLPNNGSSQTKVKARPKKQAHNNFKVNIKAVHKVLSEATRKNRDELIDLWPDLISALDVSQQAILNNSKPVAASPSGLVVTFEYDILCSKAESDEELQQAIGNYIETVLNHRSRLVCVPENRWPEIRQQFIDQMSSVDGENNGSEESDQANQEEDNLAVKSAVDMFGEENVNVKD